jgi:uncharacterized protein
MDRRGFLSLFALCIAPCQVRADRDVRVLSAWATGEGTARRYLAGRAQTANGALALPARGHAVVAHPTKANVAYVCARRPGEYLIRFDCVTGKREAEFEADELHRFEGHAVVDAARNRLFTTESEHEWGRGRIGVYDADSLQRLDEWTSHGVGPHELVWFSRDVLAVANGGILTLPETGRVKRNLDTMEPSLVLLDARDGRRLGSFTLPDRRLGIRHLACADDGTLGIALQIEGDAVAPTLALLREGALHLADVTASTAQRMNGYGAAVAANGDRFAVTCTRGDRIAVWDTRGRYCGDVAMRKPSGIAPAGSDWIVSNEFGELWRIHAASLRVLERQVVVGRLWDNHLTLLKA